MLMQLLISAAAAGLSVLAFRLQMGASGATGIFGTVFSMLLDIVPDNLLTPFTTGNTLQVLFFAVLFGTTMIIVADKVQYVAAFSEQLNCVIQAIMGFIGQLVPAFIFGSIFTLTVSSDFSTLRVCSHFAIAGLVAAVLVFAVQVTVTALKLHIPPRVLKKILPVFMVGLGTGSSAAAFSANLECSVKGFGMSEKLAGFGIPMGQIMYKPCTNLGYFLAAVSVAEFTGTGVSVEWIISAALIALILSIATPSAAGAPMACFYVIFSQLGLSGEQLALIVAVDAVLDFVFTGVNVFGVQCVLLTVAKQLDMLDFDTASGLSAKAQ